MGWKKSFEVVLLKQWLKAVFGGEGGIRTLETVSRLHAFQACAFNHSATSPIAPLSAGLHYTGWRRGCKTLWVLMTRMLLGLHSLLS